MIAAAVPLRSTVPTLLAFARSSAPAESRRRPFLLAALDRMRGAPGDSSPDPGAPSDPAMTDARLLERIAGGDRGAVASLYDRFAAPLYALLVRVLRDRTEAEDALQEVFLKV